MIKLRKIKKGSFLYQVIHTSRFGKAELTGIVSQMGTDAWNITSS